jgi:hypothetical protein
MRRPLAIVFLVLGVILGAAGGYWYARLPASTSDQTITASSVASAVERKILYYRERCAVLVCRAKEGCEWPRLPSRL